MDDDPRRRHEWNAATQRTAYCASCGRGTGFDTVAPPACPTCGSHVWKAIDPPGVPYLLTENDKTFLHRRGIQAEEDEDDDAA
jgi:hypothetical protein